MAKKKADPRPPRPLSTKEVDAGIREYQKLQQRMKGASAASVKDLSEQINVPGRKSVVQVGKTGWPPGTEKWAQKASPSLPKAKKVKPARVAAAKPVTPILPRIESRVRVAPPKGEIKVSLRELTRKLEKAAPKLPAVQKHGEIAIAKGAIGRDPAKTAVDAFSSRIEKSGISKRLASTGRGLGMIAASLIPNEKVQTGVASAVHASTAKEAAKVGAKSLGRRALPWVGAAFAGAEISAAVGAAKGAVRAQKEAQEYREKMAVKYASPLTHQRRLREREAAKVAAGGVGISASQPKVVKAAATRSDFGSAFAQARKAGAGEFEFKGKKYHTKLASEAAPQKKESLSPSYEKQSIVKPAQAAGPSIEKSEPKANFGAFLRAKHPKMGTDRFKRKKN